MQYQALNVKFSNSQLNKLNSGMKNGTEVTLNVSLNVNSNSSYQTYISGKLVFTDRQISMLRKAFKVIENSTDKIGLSGEILGRFPGPSLKTGLLLMKNVLKSLAESV